MALTDVQATRLAGLQAAETLAAEEQPVLDALLALQVADKALEDAVAAQTIPVVDPVAVAQKAVDDATTAYDAAEVTFKATQPA